VKPFDVFQPVMAAMTRALPWWRAPSPLDEFSPELTTTLRTSWRDGE
jgi:hypothetical protein